METNKNIYELKRKVIPKNMLYLEEVLLGMFSKSMDIVIQRFKTVKEEAIVCYVDGLVNKDLINRDIIRPLKSVEFNGNVPQTLNGIFVEEQDFNKMIQGLLSGLVIVFYENSDVGFTIEFRDFATRGVQVPEAETVTRGPKEGFNECININTSLLRRKIKTSNFVIEPIFIGRQSKTAVGLCYIKGIVNLEVLDTVRRKLEKIDTDLILESSNIEQLMVDAPFSTISGVGVTQKPDIAASRLVEGRVAIIIDGTPHVLTIPELFIENLQTAEDYYIRPIHATFLRWLRLFGLFLSILLPGLSVAIITFNQEMIPSVFLTNFIASSEKTPLPEGAEVFFLVVMFELLKEAGTRLPKSVGSAITIVGALIIGDAAVNANIVSAPTVIIVALTAVSSLLIPALNAFSTAYRFLFLALGASMGIIGISVGLVLLVTHVTSINSFGVPVLSSFEKVGLKYSLNDSLIRGSIKKMLYRPSVLAKRNKKRINMK